MNSEGKKVQEATGLPVSCCREETSPSTTTFTTGGWSAAEHSLLVASIQSDPEVEALDREFFPWTLSREALEELPLLGGLLPGDLLPFP